MHHLINFLIIYFKIPYESHVFWLWPTTWYSCNRIPSNKYDHTLKPVIHHNTHCNEDLCMERYVLIFSCCSSLNRPFGSGIITPSGILLNSQIINFSWLTGAQNMTWLNQVLVNEWQMMKNVQFCSNYQNGKYCYTGFFFVTFDFMLVCLIAVIFVVRWLCSHTLFFFVTLF